MNSYDMAWAVTIGLLIVGLIAAVVGLVVVAWVLWRRPRTWWRITVLCLVLLCALGGLVSLGQIAAEVL